MKGKGGGGGMRGGMRGGTITIHESGAVRKNFWFDARTAEALRRAAFEQRRSEAEIVREAVGKHLGVEGE